MKNAGNQKRLYVNYITGLFCLLYGLKTLDSQSVTYFSDILIDDLNFSTSQYTSLTTLYYLSYGVSSVALGILISKSAKRKSWLLYTTLGVSIASMIMAFVDNYIGLVICRLLSGFCSSCSLSLILGIISKNLVKNDYGARTGIINATSALIGNVIGPVLFAFMSSYYSWHGVFFLSGVCLLLSALLLLFTVKEVDYSNFYKYEKEKDAFISSLKRLFSNKVFIMCLILGILETAANLSQGVFIPLYFTNVMDMDIVQKGWFLSIRGLTYIPISFLVPILCDRFDTRTVLSGTFILAFIAPFSAFAYSGSMLSAYLLSLFGTVAEVTVSIFVYIIPRRVLPENLHSAANGIILGCSVLIGGCICPMIMSRMIDCGFSLVNIMGICALLFFICIFISLVIPVKKKIY